MRLPLDETKKVGQSTRYWWESAPEERFWMEITDRQDIGADLKCPQLHEGGGTQQSYSLIRAIWPGDVVFHYSTRARAVIGASVAGGPLEERAIVWTPHGYRWEIQETKSSSATRLVAAPIRFYYN